MNNFKYDFDRTRNGSVPGRRLRFILLFAVVLAVTGAIVYFLIPHETPTTPTDGEKPKTELPETVEGAERPNPVHPSETGSEQSLRMAETPETATETASEDAPSMVSGADAKNGKTSNGAEPTAIPEKDKPWIGDAPESPKPPSPASDAELKATEEKLAPLYSGDISSIAEHLTVAPGDSLSRIAARRHTTVEALRHYNKLKSDVIRIGQKLHVIPGPWRITVDKSRRELTLEKSENGNWRTFGRFQVGLGRFDRTPEADFVISTRLRHPDWYAPDGRIFRYGSEGNPLGDYFLKLADSGNPDKPFRGLGIHGTSDDRTVGKNWSNGCVRMHNREVELLYYLVPSGTPVRIITGTAGAGKAEIE